MCLHHSLWKREYTSAYILFCKPANADQQEPAVVCKRCLSANTDCADCLSCGLFTGRLFKPSENEMLMLWLLWYLLREKIIWSHSHSHLNLAQHQNREVALVFWLKHAAPSCLVGTPVLLRHRRFSAACKSVSNEKANELRAVILNDH